MEQPREQRVGAHDPAGEQDFANERFEAEFRERTSPVSCRTGDGGAREPARWAPSAGSDSSSQITALGAREHLAYQAMGEWSPEEREALRMLAAASPGVRVQAVSDAFGEVANGVDMTAAGPPPGSDIEALVAGAAAGARVRPASRGRTGIQGLTSKVRRRRST